MIIIREATESDIPRLLELYRQLTLAPETYQQAPLDDCCRILEQMRNTPGYKLLVAEENGEVFGTLIMVILPALAHGISPFALVEFMVVDEKYRSRGIGHRLLEYAINNAEAAGCYKIMLCSNKQRKDAHRFYHSLGFTATHEGFHRYFQNQ